MGICLEIYRTIDAHHAINTLRIAAVVLASEKIGTNRSTGSEMVRIFFHDNPKRFMTEYPGKVFAVIGPFDNRHDRPDLQEALRITVMEHNKKRRGGRLSLSERS